MLDTLYGKLSSEWTLKNETFTYTVRVPPNTSATVRLPYAGQSSLNGAPISGFEHNEVLSIMRR